MSARYAPPLARAVAPVNTRRSDDARKALELLATGTVEGKIVLICDRASALADASAVAEDAAK